MDLTEQQEKKLIDILSHKSEVFTVTLDDVEMYMNDRMIDAIVIHGIITAVLQSKKISGEVKMVSDRRDKPLLHERYEDGALNFKDNTG